MRHLKKIIIFIVMLVLAIYVGITININKFVLFDRWNLITFLSIFLGFSLTSYTFLVTPLDAILTKNSTEEIVKNCTKILKGIEHNILLMFWATIILFIFELIYKTDIPFIRDTKAFSINGQLFLSLKNLLIDLFTTFISIFSIYSFYDVMKALFVICRYNISREK